MNKKQLLAKITLVFVSLLAGWILVQYFHWKQDVISRLSEGSLIAETDSGPIEYAAIGNGPTILVIHGTPGGYDQGILIARVIDGQEFTFIAVSRPGYLRTPLDAGETPEEQADAYAALLDTLNIPTAAVLAVSGGGPSALQFALRHPDRCWGLILMSALTQSPKPLSLTSGQQFFQKVMENILTSDFGNWILSRLIRKFPNITIPQDPEAHLSDPDQVELFLELYDTMFPASLRLVGINNDEVQYNNMSPFPFSELSVPILILHGTEDKNVPFETAEFAVRTIPGAELVAIDGGPHEFFLIRSRQEAIIAIVRQFLNDYAPAK